MRWHWLLVHLACAAALLLQLALVMEGFILPTVTHISVQEVDLKDMAFPVVIKLCATPAFDATALNEAGYDAVYMYFMGTNKNNKSVIGWAGQTLAGGVLGEVEEVRERVMAHTIDMVIKKVKVKVKGIPGGVEVTDKMSLRQLNCPENCYTLDITNEDVLKGKRVKKLDFVFNSVLFRNVIDNFSIKLQVLGSTIETNRGVRLHTFFSSDQVRMC